MAVMVVALVGVVAAVAVASEVEGPGMAGEARARVGREDERATPMEATGVADAEGMESVVLVANAAQAVGTSENNIRRWMKLFAQEESGERLPTDERAELARLRRENKELRMEKEILKKASAFFAKEMN